MSSPALDNDSPFFFEIIFYGCLQYGPERIGVLGQVLNSQPFALKHLMPALMSFYIGEVEVTVFFSMCLIPSRG